MDNNPRYFNFKHAFKLDKPFLRWSGFAGGPIAGSYSTFNTESREFYYSKFAVSQKRSCSIVLTPPSYSPTESLIKIKNPVYNLSDYEMIVYLNRTAAMSVPIIFPTGIEITAPFIHPLWTSFMFQVPVKFRKNGELFKKILLRKFPEFMNFPSKNNKGLGIGNQSKFDHFRNLVKLKIRFETTKIINRVNFPPIGVNYLYYKEAIKKLPTLKNSIMEACESLENRKILPWLSPSKILNEHLKNKKDHSEALQILLGLEVNLRAEKIEPFLTLKKINT